MCSHWPASLTRHRCRRRPLPHLQGVKKPYNPIIGETFACAWRHEDGSNSQYIAEQVSHRPPVSAMYFENRQANLVINAQVWTKSKFKAPQTAVSILAGAADVHVLNYDEVVRRRAPVSHSSAHAPRTPCSHPLAAASCPRSSHSTG